MSLELAYKVHTYSSGTHGRAICNARNHHFVSDDAGGEELGAGELFFSGVAACAVNMVERIAKSIMSHWTGWMWGLRRIEIMKSLRETVPCTMRFVSTYSFGE